MLSAHRVRSAPWLLALGLSIACTPESKPGPAPIARVALPAVAPPMSPEFSLGHPSQAAAEGDDDQPGIAFDGTNYFVVWDDGVAGSIRVRGARVSPAGVVLDAEGLAIAGVEIPGAAGQSTDDAKVAFDGVNYLVTWQQIVTDFDGGGLPTRVHARRVSPSGAVVDTQDIEISSGFYATGARVAFCGTNYFVVWQSETGPVGVHVGKDGTVLDLAPVPLPVAGYSGALNVGPAAAGCLVSWLDDGAIKVSRVGNTGPLLDDPVIALVPSYSYRPPVIAFDGTNNFVAWADSSVGGMYAARVGPSGTVLDATPFSVSVAGPYSDLGAGWDGTNFLVTWPQYDQVTYGTDLWGVRISPSGARVDAADFPMHVAPGSATLPAMATGPSGVFVVWQDTGLPHVIAEPDIIGARIENGVVLDDPAVIVSAGPAAKDSVAVASDGQEYLACWRSEGTSQITAQCERRAATGAALQASDMLVSEASTPPVVASTSSNYVAAWLGGARRIGFDGTMLDATDIALPPSRDVVTSEPAIACADSACLVLWAIEDYYNSDADIEGALVQSDGTAKPTFGISTARESQRHAAVASDGTDFLVVWADCRDDPASCKSSLYAARVSGDGTLVDGDAAAVPLTSPVMTDAGVTLGDYTPAIAYDSAADQYLVVWSHGLYEGDIWGARLTTSGAIRIVDSGGNMVICDAPGAQEMPRVAYSGDGYHSLVVWDTREPDVVGGPIPNRDIHGNWVTSAGGIEDSIGFPIASSALDEVLPVVTTTRQGNLLVAYGVAEPRPGSPRFSTSIAGRLISTLAFNGTSCTSDAECASTSCRDGRCCDSDCVGSCLTCNSAVSPGVCTEIKDAEDDTCSGTTMCDSSGVCKTKTGSSCTGAADCVSTFCSDGVCCDGLCDGDCDTCSAEPGTCTFLSKGTEAASCAPGYFCSGQSGTCPSTCVADDDCGSGYFCSPTNRCAAFCVDDDDCDPGTHCNLETGRCENQATCQDDHTILNADGTTRDCDPYACLNGACKGRCATSADCAPGFQCDERATCSEPHSTSSTPATCSAGRGRVDGAPWAIGAALLALLRIGRRRWALTAAALLGCAPSPPDDARTRPPGPAIGAHQAALSGTLSPEILLSSPEVAGTNAALEPAVATDGTSFLVVFGEDAFDRAPGRAVLVSGSTAVTSVDLPGGVSPSVASGSTEYLAVWEDHGDIRAARVSRAGQVLDAAGFDIAAADDPEANPAVAFCGTHYLVVWDTNTGVFGTRVDASGTVLDAPPLVFSTTTPDGGFIRLAHAPAAAGNGSECIVAWIQNGVAAQRVGNGDPALMGPALVLPGTEQVAYASPLPSIASNGSDFLILWDAYSTFGYGVHQARVSADGTVLDPTPLYLGYAEATGNPVHTVTWDGQNYLVTWVTLSNNTVDLSGIHVPSTGAPLEAQPIALTSTAAIEAAPALASGPNGTLLTWYERGNVFGSRVDSSAALLDAPGFLLSAGAGGFQRDVAVASDGTGYFSVWHDTRDGREDIYGTRLRASGQPEDPSGIAIATELNTEQTPQVAYDGTGYLAVWLEVTHPQYWYATVKGARIGLDGMVKSAQPLALDTSDRVHKDGGLSVACAGSTCLVAWAVTTAVSNDMNIAGAIVQADDDITGIPISSAVDNQMSPVVASDGTDFLVIWAQSVGALHNVHAGRVRADGLKQDGNGVAVVSPPDQSDEDAAIAYDPVGQQYVIAWERAGDILGTRVIVKDDLLSMLDAEAPLVIANSDGHQGSPRLADPGDGHNVLAVWEHRPFGASASDIHGAWIERAGGVFGGGPLASGATLERRPAVAGNGRGSALAVYEIAEPATIEPAGAMLGARIVTSTAPDGTACTANAECASGKCREGICCQSECDTSCQTCADPSSPGICTCTGLSACTLSSDTSCSTNLGAPCTRPTECESGFCVDGFCCSGACGEPCESCAVTPGACAPLPKGSLGRMEADGGPTCLAGYLCNGVDVTCPTTCSSDEECGGTPHGAFCSDGECIAYCFDNGDCLGGDRCDTEAGKCVSGPFCDLDPSDGSYSVTEGDSDPIECGAYICTATDRCLVTCTSSAQCARGYTCDENGACKFPPDPRTTLPDATCACRVRGSAPDPEAASRWWGLAAGVLVLGRRRRSSRGWQEEAK